MFTPTRVFSTLMVLRRSAVQPRSPARASISSVLAESDTKRLAAPPGTHSTLLVAYIFNTKHGLEDLTAEEYGAAKMVDDDIEGSEEERTF